MRQMHPTATRCIGSCRGAAALIWVLCGAAACGQPRTSAHSPTATTPLAPTPTAHWAFHPVTLPVGFSNQGGSFAVSPVDGRVAWACSETGNGSFSIWMTADETTTWHSAGSMRPPTPLPAGSCGLVTDQRDAQAAMFIVTWRGGEAGDLASMSFV